MPQVPQVVVRYIERKLPADFMGSIELHYDGKGYKKAVVIDHVDQTRMSLALSKADT